MFITTRLCLAFQTPRIRHERKINHPLIRSQASCPVLSLFWNDKHDTIALSCVCTQYLADHFRFRFKIAKP